MNNDNFYKKLRCIFLILAIISIFIALVKKVKAAEHENIDNYFWNNYFIDDLNTYNIDLTSYNNYLDILKNQSTAAIRYEDNNTIQYRFLRLSDYAGYYLQGLNWSGGAFRMNDPSSTGYNPCILQGHDIKFYEGLPNSYTFGATINIGKNGQVQFRFSYTSRNTKDSQMNRSGNIIPTFEEIELITNIVASVGETVNTNNIISGSISTQHPEIYYSSYDNWLSSGLIIYGDLLVMSRYNDSYPAIINENYITPNTENTSGFSVFKYNNLGIDTLRIVPPKNKVIVGSHTSNISTVTFDLVIDETIIPTTYNSESEFYYESIEYNRAYYEIPFNTLLPSSINDFNNIYITNVVYNNSWENQGGETGSDTFYYVDKVYLKQTIDNDDIEQVSITHIDTNTGYDETHITDIYNMITNASTISGEFNTEKNLVGGSSTPYSFTSFQDAIVRTVECYHPTGTKSTDWTLDSGDNMYYLEYNDNSQVFNNRYNYNISPYSYISENNYTGYYDILYFIVHEQLYTSNGTGFSTLNNSYTRYFYFISDRYYNKLILYREMDIMEYIKLNNEISEKVYNYLYDRLLNIDDNLYYYIKDKANIDNDILTALENIDNDMQFNFDVLNDLLNKILSALSDLKLTQLDTIETKLNTIISNISQSNTENEDDTVAEAIQYYKSHNTNGVPTGQVYIDDKMSIWISGKVHLWLQGTDANTDKTNLINTVFDTLTSIYDSMKNNNDIFPNIQYYLDAIAKNNNYAYETHGDYMTRLFKGNVDISTYSGISE